MLYEFFIDFNFVSQAIIFAINVLVFLRFFYKYRYSSEYRYLYTMLGVSAVLINTNYYLFKIFYKFLTGMNVPANSS